MSTPQSLEETATTKIRVAEEKKLICKILDNHIDLQKKLLVKSIIEKEALPLSSIRLHVSNIQALKNAKLYLGCEKW